jgi:hypothetical protein
MHSDSDSTTQGPATKKSRPALRLSEDFPDTLKVSVGIEGCVRLREADFLLISLGNTAMV